jgi:cytochrome P450
VRAGSIATWVKEVHEKYGDAVRLAPNEVSFTSGETAWPDIYGFRSGKYKTTGAYLKDSTWFPKPSNGVHSMLASNEADHRRVRRNLSHAFSDKALREQEQLIMQYVDLLVYRLEEHAEAGKPVDMMSWYNYATFDIICDLTFGEPLYCLRDSVEHNWIRTVIDSVQSFGPSSVKRKYPLFDYYDKAINYFADNTTSMRVRLDFLRKSQEKVTNRLEKGTSRPDFFSYVIKNMKNEGKSLSRDEMDSNAMLFLTAGSETTATALSGTTYLLLNNPDKYAKLVHEIRSKFSSADHITIEEVNKLEYMIACLQEGLRRYPPIPTAFPRVVPPGGDHISGHFIPGGTTVYVSQHATYHSSRNFKNPNKYAPERWLGDEEYKDDVRESFNPFSFGPRNCLGKK